jgi:phosphopantetheinyl transferase
MPFTQDYLQIGNVQVHLLKYVNFDPITFLDQLTDNEKERFFSFDHENRRKEFVATRILRHRLFGFEHIHYDPNGAPYIEQEGFISISHAKDIVGIALSKDFKVGLDLETIRSKASVVAKKFLSDEEGKQFNIENSTEMTKVWSAKEVLYKLAGRKGIHFKSELLLNKDHETIFTGRIINPGEVLTTRIQILDYQGTIISINTIACESE